MSRSEVHVLLFLPSWSCGRNRATSTRQTCLEDCGVKLFLGTIREVSGTNESTQLSLKLNTFMPTMKLNSGQTRDVLMRIKQKQHGDSWRQTALYQRDLGEGTRRPWKQWPGSCCIPVPPLLFKAEGHRSHEMLYPQGFKLLKVKIQNWGRKEQISSSFYCFNYENTNPGQGRESERSNRRARRQI